MNNKFSDIFEDDPLGLLAVEPTNSASQRTDADQRLIDSFSEINSFYEENKQEPSTNGDVDELMLASRLRGIRNNPAKVKALLPYDFYDLLKANTTKNVTVEDILGDDPLNLLTGDNSCDSIFSLTHVSRSERIRPDFISRRTVCKTFVEYESMFSSIHSDLKNGRRRLTEYKSINLNDGKFFVLRGVLLYLEKSHKELQSFDFESGTRNRMDGRTRCIFDNGTESDMLFRSLDKALQKDGFGISDVVDNTHSSYTITEEDQQNGYIYVLSSLSSDPQIRKVRDLYKVGYCSGDITERIRNCKNEPTYLMSEVRVELAVRCYNLNVPNLEAAIHTFFNGVNVSFEVMDAEGNRHYPREWFIAPLPIIQDVIQLVIEGDIEQYRYDSVMQKLVLKYTSA